MRILGRFKIFTSREEVLDGAWDYIHVNKNGMYCKNVDQPDGKCHDYEVRLCCP